MPFGSKGQFTFHRRKFVSFCGLIFENGKSTNIMVTNISDNDFEVSEVTIKCKFRTQKVLFANTDKVNTLFEVFVENFLKKH